MPYAKFLKKFFEEAKRKRCSKELALAFKNLCYEDQGLSEKVLEAISAGINEKDYDEVPYFLRILSHMLLIDDSLRKFRVSKAMTDYSQILKDNIKYQKFVRVCIDFLVKQAGRNAHLRSWLQENLESWQWIVKWVHDQAQSAKENNRLMKKRQINLQGGFNNALSQRNYINYK